MDDHLRDLERRAAAGDIVASQRLVEGRIRLGLCPRHGMQAKEYDPITNQPDPAGWGTGCPACEEELFCSSGQCGMQLCHRCHPVIDCDTGHQNCFELEYNLRVYGVEIAPEIEEIEEIDEDEDDGRYDCWDCRGTGIGYPVDRSCGSCGGSGINRPREDYRDPEDYYDSLEEYDDYLY